MSAACSRSSAPSAPRADAAAAASAGSHRRVCREHRAVVRGGGHLHRQSQTFLEHDARPAAAAPSTRSACARPRPSPRSATWFASNGSPPPPRRASPRARLPTRRFQTPRRRFFFLRRTGRRRRRVVVVVVVVIGFGFVIRIVFLFRTLFGRVVVVLFVGKRVRPNVHRLVLGYVLGRVFEGRRVDPVGCVVVFVPRPRVHRAATAGFPDVLAVVDGDAGAHTELTLAGRRPFRRVGSNTPSSSSANAFASGSESPEEEASSRSASRATAPPVGSKSSSGSSVLTGAGFASPASSAERPPPARLVLVFIGRLARLALGRQSAAAVFFRVRAAARHGRFGRAGIVASGSTDRRKIRLNGHRVLFQHTHARGRSATTRGAPAASRDGRRVLDARSGLLQGSSPLVHKPKVRRDPRRAFETPRPRNVGIHPRASR